MPLYEYRCRSCDTLFSVRRPMSESSLSATCPNGHDDSLRLLSSFAAATVGGGGSGGTGAGASAAASPSSWTGGGCGGGCACH